MFGTGFRGALEGDGAWLAEEAARSQGARGRHPLGRRRSDRVPCAAPRCARRDRLLRVPEAGLLFEPGRSGAGTVEVVDIGVDFAGDWPAYAGTRGCRFGHCATTADDAREALGVRARDEHKWRAAVLVVGGSAGMIGAPGLTARAALRTGSGMVVAGVPGDEAAARIGGGEVVARALAATADGALTEAAIDDLLGAYIERFKAVAIGPGLGRAPQTAAAVARLVAAAPVPLVIDADALTALAADPAPLVPARRATNGPRRSRLRPTACPWP